MEFPLSLTDVDYKGDLELHVKYGGVWLMKTGKANVQSKDLIQEIENLSLALQRAIDKVSRGQSDKNMIKAYGEEEFGDGKVV